MDPVAATETSKTLGIALNNKTSSNDVYAYITGRAIDNNGRLFLLQADGQTPYYPTSPASDGSTLAVDCGIKLGAPGSYKRITIPRIAGGRIWFCISDRLTFLLNPGPGLVEPSVSNPSDPNFNKRWGFCEFTFNEREAFVNISYVDFVCLPIALTLRSSTGPEKHVGGLLANGLNSVCSGLEAQDAIDKAGWSQLVVKTAAGKNLRALSPNTAIVMNRNLFSGYFTNYVNSVWAKYTSTPLTVNTQYIWGTVVGRVVNNVLTFPNIGTFSKPSAADIFSCSTGPFAHNPVNSEVMGNIGARLAAAFNRSTLLTNDKQPDGEVPSTYYKDKVTNHYSRIVHQANEAKRGYAFPYDDVVPSGGTDQSGSISDGSPSLLIVSVGN